MIITWLVGITASILTATGLIPQVIKGFVRKHVKDISIFWLIIGGAGTFLWFIYGILIKDNIIIFANSINATCYFLIILQKQVYKNESLIHEPEKS